MAKLPLFGFFNHPLISGAILGSGVLDDDIFESCLSRNARVSDGVTK